MIVSGTAGTGKSYLIHCLRLLLQHQLVVAAPTRVAAFNINGQTLHSLLSLPTTGEFKDLEGERLTKLQQSFSEVKYLIIDEISMVGRKTLGQVDRRLRQAGQDPEQVQFRDILLRLRDTLADWNHLMTCTPTRVQDVSPFSTASHLIPTLWSSTMLLNSRPVASPLPPSRQFTLDPMQPRPQQEDWRQLSASPSQPV
jgi:hypothetical protein